MSEAAGMRTGRITSKMRHEVEGEYRYTITVHWAGKSEPESVVVSEREFLRATLGGEVESAA